MNFLASNRVKNTHFREVVFSLLSVCVLFTSRMIRSEEVQNMNIPENLPSMVEPIVRSAGKILLSYFNKPLQSWAKEDKTVVTQADLASEKYLVAELAKLIPNVSFLAEESGASGNDDYCWVIDPLDGTTNFAHALPYFCISVALTYQGKAVFGAIYLPLLNEYFYAQDGQGAYLNGSRIMINAANSCSDTWFVMDMPATRVDAFLKQVKKMGPLNKRSYTFRRLGSTATELAYLACGRLNGLVLGYPYWWDVAAGLLLVREAGGIVTDPQGGVVDHVGQDFTALIASGASIHEELRNLLEPYA